MKFSIFIGLRHLRSKKESRFLSLITYISVVGVTIGVMTLLVILSVMEGFELELNKRLMNGQPHIVIESTKSRYFVPEANLTERLYNEVPEIYKVVPVLSTETIIKSDRKVMGALIKGVPDNNLLSLKLMSSSSDKIDAIENPSNAPGSEIPNQKLFVVDDLADQLGLLPNDVVTLVSPVETDASVGSIPRFKKFKVEAIYTSVVPEREYHTVYASIKDVRSFLRQNDILSHYEIMINDFSKSEIPLKKIQNILGENYRVKDWKMLNAHLFTSLRLERIAMFLALGIIVLVASFNIVTALSMMVIEKRKEISILRAIGASKFQIGRIFLSEGFLIGAFGSTIGLFLGTVVLLVLKNFQVIQLPDVFYDRTLPVQFNYWYYLLIGFFTMTVVLLAAWIPANKASKLDPMDGIRYSK